MKTSILPFVIVKIRLILKDGTFREQLGQAESTNMPYKHMCYASARKKAVTDAIKSHCGVT